jgi:gliding motility-associated-like protein
MQTFLRSSLSVLIALAALIYSNTATAQFQITTPDTSICPGTNVTLNTSYVGLAPVSVALSDDQFTGIIPLGFTFTYFSNSYTSCVFSSNGYIQFNTAAANQYSPWVIGNAAGTPSPNGAIPGNIDVYNSIMGFYADILPMSGQGTLDYTTIGTAPNRKFILNFCDVPMFSCTNLLTSFQIILYETTNVIEVHLTNAPSCTLWNGGYAIEGIQNNNGTVAYPVPGRNYPTQWSASQSSNRWTPSGSSTSSYTLSAIPYAPLPIAGGVVSWYANGTNFIGTGDSMIVSPTVNTFYVAQVTKCQDTARDTVYVTIGGGSHIDSIKFTNPTTCGGSDGTITLYGLDTSYNHYDIYYRKNGVGINPFPLVSTDSGTLNITGLTAGSYDSIIAFKGLCFSNLMSAVLTDPPAISDFTYSLKLGCEADTVVFTNTSIENTYNEWKFGDGTTDTTANPTHVYLVQGAYYVQLNISNGVCTDSSVQQINTAHPLIASFTLNDDSVCTNQEINFTNNSTVTAGQASYYWDFGDGTNSTTEEPSHTYTGPGNYTVMLIAGDNIPCHDTAFMNIQVDSLPYLNFIVTDSALCEGQAITFISDYLLDGNTGLIWNFGDGNQVLDQPTISRAYDSSGLYTVSLRATYRNCPDTVYTKEIDIVPFPTIDLGPDTTICPNGDPIRLKDYKNRYIPGASWLWNNGDTASFILVKHPGIYTARVTLGGCSQSDSIEIFKDCYIDIPNSFTPNGDGLNDYFFPRQLLSGGLTEFKMTIYNRWGQEIFQTLNLNGRGWDGKFNDKEQPMDVYIYVIDLTMKNGYKEHYQGNVTLLR